MDSLAHVVIWSLMAWVPSIVWWAFLWRRPDRAPTWVSVPLGLLALVEGVWMMARVVCAITHGVMH